MSKKKIISPYEEARNLLINYLEKFRISNKPFHNIWMLEMALEALDTVIELGYTGE